MVERLKVLLKFKYTLLYFIILYSYSVKLNYGLDYANGLRGELILGVSNALIIIFFLMLVTNLPSVLKIPIITIISMWVAFDIGYISIYKTPIYIGNMGAILTTNKSEAMGLMGIIGLKALSFLVVSLFLNFMSAKELKTLSLKKTSIIGLGFIMFFLLLETDLFCRHFCHKNNQRFSVMQNAIILRDASMIYDNFIDLKYINKYNQTPRILPNYITLDKEKSKPEKIFVILGESSLVSHYSLYGYERPTTPYLDKLSEDKSILHFEDAISASSITVFSLRHALTLVTPKNQEPLLKEKNLIELAQDVGYEVIWLATNGTVIGKGEGGITMIARTSDKVRFYEVDLVKDTDLLNEVDKYLKPKVKQLIFIHISGSHLPYSYRVDPEINKGIEGNSELDLYDKSIQVTDYFIYSMYNKVFNKLKEPSLLVYFSDHGEIIGKGHGFLTDGAKQFQIPLIMASNFIPKKELENLVNSYRSPLGYYNTFNFSNTLAEIIGYSFPDSVKSRYREEGDYIFHVDMKTYKYEDILKIKNE